MNKLDQALMKRRAIKHFAKDQELCDRLAERLDIEADGGDSPGAFVQDIFVQWCLEQADDDAERSKARARKILGVEK